MSLVAVRFVACYLGADVAVRTDYTAPALLRRCELLEEKEERTEGLPVLEVRHLARKRGVLFTDAAREVVRLIEAAEGWVTVAVEENGPGAGLVQELGRRGVRVNPVVVGAGGRVGVHGRRYSVPRNLMLERCYTVMTQGRLRVPRTLPLAHALASDMLSVEAEYTDAGTVRYVAPTSPAINYRMSDSRGEAVVPTASLESPTLANTSRENDRRSSQAVIAYRFLRIGQRA